MYDVYHKSFLSLPVILLSAVFAFVSAVLSASENSEGMVTFKKDGNGIITISVDGEFFAQYRSDADIGCKGGTAANWDKLVGVGGTPVIWPICSDNGTLMSRGYPMDSLDDNTFSTDPVLNNIFENSKLDTHTAEKDHVHHRSLWFNHGDVNKVDFWGPDKGRIVQQAIISITEEAHSVTIITKNAWIPEQDAAPLCTDVRTITFGVIPEHPEIRYIDYDVDLTATADEVRFGDTKEGSFGFRIPGSMDVTAKDRSDNWGGKILNSSHEEDDAAWGKRASWVDYYGPAPKRLTDAELAAADPEKIKDIPLTAAGVDIMNHPTSFRYPSWYHVRTYGLFAVNPFGIASFEQGTSESGELVLRKGEGFSVRYRVLLHDEHLSFDELESLFSQYKSVSK